MTVNPWEEQWFITGMSGRWLAANSGDPDGYENWALTDYGEDDGARAKLAAAAPDMARALLEVEWGGFAVLDYDGMGSACCPACYGIKPGEDLYRGAVSSVDHQPDCELLEALKKAGVRA